MFYGTSFMKILEQRYFINKITYTAWDTLNVTDMNFMFAESSLFNSSIGIGIHLKLLIC
jgi:hypothetical protein